MRLELAQHRENTIDVRVLVVETIEGAGEPHGVARIVPLVKLLAAEKEDTAASKARRNSLILVAASAFAAWK